MRYEQKAAIQDNNKARIYAAKKKKEKTKCHQCKKTMIKNHERKEGKLLDFDAVYEMFYCKSCWQVITESTAI